MPYLKRGTWYLSIPKLGGGWERVPSEAKLKTEAKRLELELRQKRERQRLGLEALPSENGGGTVAELMTWWLETHSKHSPTYARDLSFVGKHLVVGELAAITLAQLSPGRIDAFLLAKQDVLAPESINHLRRYLVRAINRAREAERWNGDNPAERVKSRRVPRRPPDYLRADEVPRVLEQIASRWRPLFATAIYTGMRKGELFALRKSDVDIQARLVTVARSHDRDMTKGGRTAVLPIATELVPFLDAALSVSTSELVFPGKAGKHLRPDIPLAKTLRVALARAGIVLGYQLTCRRKGCGHREEQQTNDRRRCPKCKMQLWPKTKVRPIRFHDLRHTTASLMMMAGANPAAVQRILRHSDPRITTEIYGHLSPGYLRAEVDRLAFNPKPAPVEKEQEPVLAVANLGSLATRPLPGDENESSTGKLIGENYIAFRGFRESGREDSNLRPSAPKSGHLVSHGLAANRKPSKTLESGVGARGSASPALGAFSRNLATRPLPKLAGSSPTGLSLVLTVREVADRLKVSTATIYKLCEVGKLDHFRVSSNAIRIELRALERFINEVSNVREPR